MKHFSGDTRIVYLSQFYTAEQIARYCAGSEDRLNELYVETQPQVLPIEALAGVNDGERYLCDSPDGWVPVEQWRNKGLKSTYRVDLDSGLYVTASDDHLFQKTDGAWVFTRDLVVNDELLTEFGPAAVTGIAATGPQVVYDLAIGHENHRYFTNGVSSHNSGKSVILQNLAVNWALDGHNVVYISLELNEDLIGLRLDAMITGRGTPEVMSNIGETVMLLKRAGQNAGRLNIKKLPQGGTTVADLRAYLKEYEIRMGAPPDALLVDYLDLLYPNSKGVDVSNLFVKDKFVSEELRGLMHEGKMFGATASQLNRGATQTQEFDHSHIAGGISKINTADNVIGLLSTPSMKEKGVYEMQFLKTRSSAATGQSIRLGYDPVTMRLSDPVDGGEEKAHSVNDLRAQIKARQAAAAPAIPSAAAQAAVISEITALMGPANGPV